MKLKHNEFLAVVYADIFDWPLSEKERKFWAIGKDKVVKNISIDREREEKLWKVREDREREAKRKDEKAHQVAGMLAGVSTVEAIFLTGSVAVGNTKRGSDIDLMIITAPGALWMTRLMVFWLLRRKGLYKKIICPNIFLDANHLEIEEKNLYTAHEVLQAKCLFDRYDIERRWLEKNGWVEKYLSNVFRLSLRALAKQPNVDKGQIVSSLALLAMTPVEIIAFVVQYLYMKRKITYERVGWGYAFFHPRNLSNLVVGEFERRTARV